MKDCETYNQISHRKPSVLQGLGAENPDELIVYGGSGWAARNWD